MGLFLQRRPEGLKILEASAPGSGQHFTPRFVDEGLADGWLTLSGTRLVLIGTGGALIYRLDRPPGIYCCHCDAAIDDSEAARTHVSGAHADVASPDASNPAGYRYDHFFATTRLE